MSVEDKITRERILAEYSLIAFGDEVEMQYKIKALQDLSKQLAVTRKANWYCYP